MKLQKPIIFILFMFGFYSLYAGNHIVPQQFINHTDWNFVENKGQLPSSEIQYYGHQGGVYLYCQPGKISFVFTKVENNETAVSEATGNTVGVQNPEPLHRNNPLDRSSLSALHSSVSTSSTLPAIALATARTDLVLLNSNPSAQIIASDLQEYYENFYLSNTDEYGIINVLTYKTITYKSIYPNIDLVLLARPKGMKYEFVVYPGGNVNDIQIQWNGLEEIKKLKDSKIEYSCSLGKMTESKPFSFQGDILVKSSFIQEDNRIGFNVGRYDKTKPLVIDPYLMWGTYFGGSGTDAGNGLAVDASGNVFITGGTISTSGIATSGAFQTFYSGGTGNNYVYQNGYLAKFNSSGKIQWATYFGDSSMCNAVAIDMFDNIYITGNTNGNYSIATSGAYQGRYKYSNNFNGIVTGDAFLEKFNNNGFRQWGTYFGGISSEYNYTEGLSIATDNMGNVYFTGLTTNPTSIATSGAYQTHSGDVNFGNQGYIVEDAFLAKFNDNGGIQWATYYGYNGYYSGTFIDAGKGETVGYSVATDLSGNVFIGGVTGSVTNIATNGAYQTSFSGRIANDPFGPEDGFLVKFNNAGSIQWGTYFGDSLTNVRGVATDPSGNIYIVGTTADTALSTINAYKSKNSGYNAFLAKFDQSGSVLWSSYYGGTSSTEGTSVCTDKFGAIYISGATSSLTNIATSCGYEPTFSGIKHLSKYNDFNNGFLAKFNGYGSRLWGTYFVEDSDGYGAYLCTADAFGNVYLSGTTESDSGIATNGAYQTSNAGNVDAFLAKFRIIANDDAGIAYLPDPVSSVCKGVKPIRVLLQNYGLYQMDSVTINWSVNGKPEPPFHWAGNLAPDSIASVAIGSYDFANGAYTVKSWTSRPNGVVDSIPCNDTFTTIINVNALPPIANIGQASYAICHGTRIKIGGNAQPDYAYSWSSVPSGFSSTLPNPVVSPDSNTEYDLTVTDTLTGCTNKNSANVGVSLLQAPAINVGKNQSICFGDSVQIGSPAINGDIYIWSSNPTGYNSTIANPVIKPIITTSYLLTVTGAQGCTNFDSVIIIVNPKPVVVTGHFLDLCAGLVIPLGGPPSPGYTYEWTSTPPGFFSNLSDPTDSPRITTEYHLKVTIPATGCTDSGNITFGVEPQPAAPVIDVKNIGGFEYIFKLKNADTAANYIWNFGDSSITHNEAYYDSIMLHTYSGNGNYKLTVEAAENHCVAYTHDVINVNQAFALNIFPNPFDLQTEIQYSLINTAHVRISLTDKIGRQIGTLIDAQQNKGEYDLKYDGAAWKTRSGMYFVVFQLDDQVIVKKIIQLDSIFY